MLNTHNFVWTQDAITNLQYITAYAEKYKPENHYGDWLNDFPRYQELAIEFSKDEPDWDKSDVDYETTIEAFCKKKFGY